MATRHPLDDLPPGIKIAAQMSPEPTAEDLQNVRQMGVTFAVTWTDAAHAGFDYYASRRQLFAEAGITLYGCVNVDVHNVDAIVLGLPSREAKIEEYLRHLRALGQAGIPYTTYAHMASDVWSTPPETTRGGARARAFDLVRAEAGEYPRGYSFPLTHGREYTEEELWDHYTSFIKRAASVAEEVGVLIGIHPDDPPGLMLGGVPRCLFSSFAGYRRALAIANSPHVGLCLCVGCWLEGGDAMGKSVVDAIHHFGAHQQLFKIHFRNVNRPLPHFVETFVDDGYMDLYRVMKALREVEFKGVLIPDHIPQMAGGSRVGTAFTIGYMQALLRRANEEVGGE